jgi:hypothetical protein
MSTFLTLFIIPCVYSVFDDLLQRGARALKKGRRSALVEEALADPIVE